MCFEPNIKAHEVVLDRTKWYLDMTAEDEFAVSGPDFYDTTEIKQGLIDGTWKCFDTFHELPTLAQREHALKSCVAMLEGVWIMETFHIPMDAVFAIVASGKHLPI